jgi:hypothetical protein
MEEDFYASIKLKTGEEIFAKVMPCEEANNLLLLITNPVIITEVNLNKRKSGYKVEPWLKTTSEDMFIINMKDILTISESKDSSIINMHQTYTRSNSVVEKKKESTNRHIGYISTIEDAKKSLENIYNNL